MHLRERSNNDKRPYCINPYITAVVNPWRKGGAIILIVTVGGKECALIWYATRTLIVQETYLIYIYSLYKHTYATSDYFGRYAITISGSICHRRLSRRCTSSLRRCCGCLSCFLRWGFSGHPASPSSTRCRTVRLPLLGVAVETDLIHRDPYSLHQRV
jgi:hypothetical protein